MNDTEPSANAQEAGNGLPGFILRVSGHLLRAIEEARRIGVFDNPESYPGPLIPLLGQALKELDLGVGAECTFLAVRNHTHTGVSVVGTTSMKGHLFRPSQGRSRFLEDIAAGRFSTPVPLRRYRYDQDWLWDRIRTSMAVGAYAEPWQIAGVPLALPPDSSGQPAPEPDGFVILVGHEEWLGIRLNDTHLRLLVDALEGTVKTLQILSQMAEAQAVMQSSQKIDQRSALHGILEPLMNQELAVASAELAVQQGNRKEALEALEKIRSRMLRAALATRNYLELAFGDLQAGLQASATDEWAQTELVVNKVVEELKPEATPKRLTIGSSLRSVPRIPMREADLELVVRNLLHNAIKYSFAGTKIEIVLIGREPEVVIDFVSHGIPIPPSDFENVFKVGFRTALASKMAFTAAGIGLPSARAKVRAQGGRLFVKSSQFERRVDEGDQHETAFRLRLNRGKKGHA